MDNSNALVKTRPIAESLAEINQQIEKIQTIHDSPWRTSGKITGASSTLDIKECKDGNILAAAIGSIAARVAHAQKGYELLGITTYPEIKVDGSPLEDWVHDGKHRLSIINQKEELDELMEIKRAYEELMDKNDKLTLVEERANKFLAKKAAIAKTS